MVLKISAAPCLRFTKANPHGWCPRFGLYCVVTWQTHNDSNTLHPPLPVDSSRTTPRTSNPNPEAVFYTDLPPSMNTGWTVRGSNPGEGKIFGTRPDQPWDPPSLLYNGYWVFPGGKAAWAWRLPPTSIQPEAKEGVELYLYSTPVSSCPVLGWYLPLPLLWTPDFFAWNEGVNN
jgi:hypothetical protein